MPVFARVLSVLCCFWSHVQANNIASAPQLVVQKVRNLAAQENKDANRARIETKAGGHLSQMKRGVGGVQGPMAVSDTIMGPTEGQLMTVPTQDSPGIIGLGVDTTQGGTVLDQSGDVNISGDVTPGDGNELSPTDKKSFDDLNAEDKQKLAQREQDVERREGAVERQEAALTDRQGMNDDDVLAKHARLGAMVHTHGVLDKQKITNIFDKLELAIRDANDHSISSEQAAAAWQIHTTDVLNQVKPLQEGVESLKKAMTSGNIGVTEDATNDVDRVLEQETVKQLRQPKSFD